MPDYLGKREYLKLRRIIFISESTSGCIGLPKTKYFNWFEFRNLSHISFMRVNKTKLL